MSGWRLDAQGRLISPRGVFVARVVGGDMFFWDRRRRCEEPAPFTIEQWMTWTVNDEDEQGRDANGG